MDNTVTFLKKHVLRREEVDNFLDPDAPNWAIFDPELGYTLKSCFVRDGLDDSFTIGHYEPTGERRSINYAHKPCRINAYGNSYTQCHQVSDPETWEEYLAGHLGEPLRNYGVGGYGVYQSYRRMKRVESTDRGGDYILFGLMAMDDHWRSLDAWRRLRCGNWFEVNDITMFHANPWDHVRLSPETGKLVEVPSLCPTPESLYRLCDEDFVVETFRRDAPLNMYLGQMPGFDPDLSQVLPLAEWLGMDDAPLKDPATRPTAMTKLYTACGIEASLQICEHAQAFATARGKKLRIMLMYGNIYLIDIGEGKPRPDQAFLDGLEERGIPYIDTWDKHVEDYKAFRLSPQEYMQRYCVAHYGPAGNHFVAYAIKDEMVAWLDPNPVVYPEAGKGVRFDEYLPGIGTS